MEILLLLLGELAATLLLPALFGVIEAVAFLVALAAEWIGWRRRRRADRRGEPRPTPRAPRWLRGVLRGSLVVFVVALAGVAVLDMFFFEAITRKAIARLATRTGIAVEIGGVEGSLWTMRATLTDVHASRTGHATSDFDLTAGRVDVDVRVVALALLRVRLQSLTLDRVTGTYTRTGVAERSNTRRPFEVDRLEASAVDVRFADRTRAKPVDARIEIDRLVATPFRSRSGLFDLLFRADWTARIDGSPIAIAGGADDADRPVRWRVDAAPIALVAPYLPGPLGWLDGGTVSIDVDGPSESSDVLLQTVVVFRDIAITAPPDVGLTRRVVAKPVIAYVERRAKHLPLSFTMRLDRGAVEASASPEAAGLLAAFGGGLLRALGEESRIAKAVIDRLRDDR